jgi:tyrosyl-tRNA synthetase
LASRVVEVLFGKDAVVQAEKISKVLFWWADIMETISSFTKEDLDALAEETWSITTKEKEIKVLDIFTQSGLTSSNGDAKKMLQSWALFVNEVKVKDPQMTLSQKDFINDIILLRKWKKQFKIIKTS